MQCSLKHQLRGRCRALSMLLPSQGPSRQWCDTSGGAYPCSCSRMSQDRLNMLWLGLWLQRSHLAGDGHKGRLHGESFNIWHSERLSEIFVALCPCCLCFAVSIGLSAQRGLPFLKPFPSVCHLACITQHAPHWSKDSLNAAAEFPGQQHAIPPCTIACLTCINCHAQCRLRLLQHGSMQQRQPVPFCSAA